VRGRAAGVVYAADALLGSPSERVEYEGDGDEGDEDRAVASRSGVRQRLTGRGDGPRGPEAEGGVGGREPACRWGHDSMGLRGLRSWRHRYRFRV